MLIRARSNTVFVIKLPQQFFAHLILKKPYIDYGMPAHLCKCVIFFS